MLYNVLYHINKTLRVFSRYSITWLKLEIMLLLTLNAIKPWKGPQSWQTVKFLLIGCLYKDLRNQNYFVNFKVYNKPVRPSAWQSLLPLLNNRCM